MSTKKSDIFMICIAAAIISTGFLATDIYLPSMPAIQESFATTDHLVQLSISLNLLSAAIFGLFVGPLADKFGRRPLLLFAVITIFITSCICALSTSITTFLIARLLQGVGIGAAAVVGFLIPRDLFSSKKATQSLSLMGLLTVSTPAIAPLIGGQIQIYFGWRMSLTLIAALCLILLFLMLFYFKETLPNEQRLRNRLSEVFHNYGKMLKHQTFMSYTILTPLLFTAELCYFTILPFYFINQLGFAPNIFGIYLSLIICAYLLASIFMPKLIAVFNPDKLIKTGISLSIISCVGLVICAIIIPQNVISIAIMLALHQFSMALIFSPALTAILDLFPQNKGSVSALRNSLLTAGAALGSFAGTIMSEDTLIQMSIFMLVPSLCCYWAFSKRKSSAQTS